MPLLTLGSALLERGEKERARPLLEEALATAQATGDTLFIGRRLYTLAIAARQCGDYDRTGGLLGESLAVFRDLRNTLGVAFCLDVAASAGGARGAASRAARLWGAPEALREGLSSRRTAQQRRLFEPYLEGARARLG